MTQVIVVEALASPERLDKFLVRKFPDTSRNYWQEHLHELVRLDGRKASKGQLLCGGEKIELLEWRREVELIPNATLRFPILYEDEFLLALDKPAGLPCYPLQNDETETLINGIVAQWPAQLELATSEGAECGLIHRLDNETSGVIVLAKNIEIKKQLQQMQREEKIHKSYLAWVEGEMFGQDQFIWPVAHHPKNKKKMWIPDEASSLDLPLAITAYEAIEIKSNYTLLKLDITKGRRHQIRVQLAYAGHPIVGDVLYGGQPLEKSISENHQRHLLHADQIDFTHPVTGEVLHIKADLPQDFKNFTKNL